MKIKNLKTKLFAAFIMAGLVALSLPLHSQQVFTIDKAIETALKNNPDTKIARLEVEKADAAISEAYGYAYPSLDVTANFSHFLKKPIIFFPDFNAMLTNASYSILFDEGVLPRDSSKFLPMGLSELSMVQSNSYEATAQVTQVLFNSAVFQGIGASQVYYETAQEQLKAKVVNIVNSVENAFFGVLLTREFVKITSESFENARNNYNNVKALYDQGLVAEFDRLQAEVQVENIRPQLIEVENAYKNALDGLKMTMGIDPKQEINIEGTLEYNGGSVPDSDQSITEALTNNYDLSTLRMKRELDEAFIQIDESDYYPTIAAFGNYSLGGQSDDLNFMNYNSSVVGLSFSINLFNGLRTSRKVQQKQIAVMQTDEQLFQLKDAIKMQVRMAILNLEKVKNTIEARERTVTVAQRAYELSEIRYKEGTGNQLEIQNADMALRQAKTNRLQAVYDYLKAQSDLNMLLGKVDSKYIKLGLYNNENK